MQLLSHMDPIILETLRSIIRKDMRSEIEDMRNSDEGCSAKCQLIKKLGDVEVTRCQKIVANMMKFEWCDNCTTPEQTGAVTSGACTSKCGHRLVKSCIPLMQEYGRL